MARHRIRHVVWDFNGTLIDDVPLIHAALNVAYRGLGLPSFTTEELQTHYTRPLLMFHERLLGRPVPEDECRRINAAFLEHYAVLGSSTPLTRGAREALVQTGAMGWTQSVCSMYPQPLLDARVRDLGIAHHFVSVEGLRGAVVDTKSELLALHIGALGIPGKETVMIGDSLDDAEAAAQAGAGSVLVDSGIHHRSVLAAAGVRVGATLADALRQAAEDGD
jgi:phosphoglycolate phosphatase-like HAD superfamily hydrolase